VLKTEAKKMIEIAPFPFKKKLSNVVYNSNGKFFCFVVESNRDLPNLFVYDVKEAYPEFDRHWSHFNKVKNPDFKIKNSDLNEPIDPKFEKNLYLDPETYNLNLMT
jgi:hypothetical protein